jgi:tRNA(fMet)-specific endonuclease VapC
MNGNKYFLDTNDVIALLQGNEPIKKILTSPLWIGVSVISVLEFLAFPGLSIKDKFIFFHFVDKIELIGISADDLSFLESLADFKRETSLKLPDAILASYAIRHQAILISNDNHFEGIDKLNLQKF